MSLAHKSCRRSKRKVLHSRNADDLSEIKGNAISVLEDQDLADADGDAIEVAGDDYKKIGNAVDNAIGDEGNRKEKKVGLKFNTMSGTQSKKKGLAFADADSDAIEVARRDYKKTRQQDQG